MFGKKHGSFTDWKTILDIWELNLYSLLQEKSWKRCQIYSFSSLHLRLNISCHFLRQLFRVCARTSCLNCSIFTVRLQEIACERSEIVDFSLAPGGYPQTPISNISVILFVRLSFSDMIVLLLIIVSSLLISGLLFSGCRKLHDSGVRFWKLSQLLGGIPQTPLLSVFCCWSQNISCPWPPFQTATIVPKTVTIRQFFLGTYFFCHDCITHCFFVFFFFFFFSSCRK